MSGSDRQIVGKNCLITGSSRGIGFHTARALAVRGAHVILVGHHQARGEQARERIAEAAGDDAARFFLADLSAQEQVRQLAREVRDHYTHLDVLVNNVGALFMERQETVDGIEMTFALNHLSYFLLTGLLLDVVKDSAPARIVNVASDTHRYVEMDFEDLQSEKGYRGFRAYARSKLANLLFTHELARRLEGSEVTVNALHPGFVNSDFYRRLGILGWLITPFASLFGKSAREGAETPIYLASSPDVAGVSGAYFIDCEPTPPSPASRDEETARRLWRVSEEMTGLSY